MRISLWARRLVRRVDVLRQFVARADVELLEDVAQVRLNRRHAHEELLRDLPICQTAGGQLGDPALGAGERVDTAERQPTRSRSAGTELLARPLRQGCRP